MPTVSLPLTPGPAVPLGDLIRAYKEHCAETRRQKQGRPPKPISGDEERHAIAAVLAGARHLTGLSGDRLLATDARPLLLQLVGAARAAATPKRKKNARGEIQHFLSVVLGGLPGKSIKSPARFLPQTLLPLVPIYDELGFQQSFLLTVARAASYCRLKDAPRRMPTSEQVHGAMRALGLKTSYASNVTSSYRAAREVLVSRDPSAAERFAELKTNMGKGRHLLTLAEVKAKMRFFHEQFELYQQNGLKQARNGEAGESGEPSEGRIIDGRRPSFSWNRHTEDAVRVWATLIVRHYDEMKALAGDMMPSLEEFYAAALLEIRVATGGNRRGGKRKPGEEAKKAKQITLAQWLIEKDAPNARARKHYRAADGDTRTTAAQLRDYQPIWSIIMYNEDYDPDEVLEARHKRLYKKLKDNSCMAAPGVPRMSKKRLLELVSCPLLQLVLIPAFERYTVDPLFEVYERARTDAARIHPDHPGVAAAFAEWAEASEQLYIVSLGFADGLRRRQYTNGLLGRHIMPRLDRDGLRVGLKTHWWGDVNDPAGLKIDMTRRLDSIEREMDVPTGLVSEKNAKRYESLVRPARIASRGLTGEELSLFISPRNDKGGEMRSFMSLGAYSPGHLSKEVFGKGLHRIVKTTLGLGDHELPAWEDLDEKWRGLFDMHILRTFIATYWAGVRGTDTVNGSMSGREMAKHITMDTDSTLDTHYVEEMMWQKHRLMRDDIPEWQKPHAYDSHMDAMWRGATYCVLDDPSVPLPAGVRELMKTRAKAVKDAAKRGRIPGQVDIRPARPDQREAFKS